MLPSNYDVAQLCLGIYRYAGVPSVAFDHFDAGEDDGVCWAVKRLEACTVVVLRGSTTPHDWLDDFAAAPIQTRVGTVHAGFHDGLEHMWGDLRRLLEVDRPVIVTGHSLGAARASILTALMLADGVVPARRVVFGEPKPGFDDHTRLVAGAPGFSYCNGAHDHDDLVCEVPFTLPPLFRFTRASPLIAISNAPAPNDRWGIFAFHHMQLYAADKDGQLRAAAA